MKLKCIFFLILLLATICQCDEHDHIVSKFEFFTFVVKGWVISKGISNLVPSSKNPQDKSMSLNFLLLVETMRVSFLGSVSLRIFKRRAACSMQNYSAGNIFLLFISFWQSIKGSPKSKSLDYNCYFFKSVPKYNFSRATHEYHVNVYLSVIGLWKVLNDS